MNEGRFTLTVDSAEGPPRVTVEGEVDLANVADFEKAMAAAVNGSKELTVDLTGVSYCDSSAVRTLFALAATSKLTMVVSATGHIKTLLGISGLDRVAAMVIRE